MTTARIATKTGSPHADPPGDERSLRLAAIDVGSNSIHMIVAQVDPDGGVTTLWRLKEPTGLGRLSFPSRRIDAEVMERALRTLARFAQAARARSAEKIIAVATSAVREATNGGDLIEAAWRRLRLRVRVVSAREEARLIYLGVRHAGCLGDVPDEPGLVLDIGGGSVELILGTNERAMVLESRKLGAARMTARFIRSDPPTPEEISRLRAHYRRELAPLVRQVARTRPARFVGTSGTLENISAMCARPAPSRPAGGGDSSATVPQPPAAQQRPDDNAAARSPRPSGKPVPLSIRPERLDMLVESLLASTSQQRARLPGLDNQRKDQIIAGVVLVQEMFSHFAEAGMQRLDLCGAALREGILIDYLERKLPALRIRREIPDPRRRSVLDLCRRCEWHKDHSEQVTRLTMRLFDQLAPLHKLGASERELIEYAALMHDIGWHIGGKGHHNHSAYLIRHGRLIEFTAEEVEIMANTARYHRKSPPRKKHAEYAALPEAARRTVDFGAALLRVADGLDRSHSAVVRDLRCEPGPRHVEVILETRGDAELEIWGARRKGEWFEEVFGRELRFTTDAP